MKPSIFYKIFFGHLVLIFIVLASLLIFSLNLLNKYSFEMVFKNLRNSGICMLPSVSGFLEEEDYAGLENLIKDSGRDTGIRFTVISPSGEVLADSYRDPAGMENHLNRPEVVSALKDMNGESLRFSSTVRAKMLYAAVPVKQGNETAAVFRGSLKLAGVMESLSGIKSRIFYAVLIAFFGSAAGALILTLHITGPLKQMTEAAEKIAGGDFDFKMPVVRKDETGRLAGSFNLMAERTASVLKELSIEKEQLDCVISSMREGLVLIDGRDRIVKRNASFEKIAGPCPEGKPYWECLRDYPASAFIKKAREKKDSLVEEVSFGGRVFNASAVNLPGKTKRTAVIFNDITELKNIEKAKKDFVANVSHELKTPLTAVKGFAETLEGEVSEEGKGYLEIIRRHSDRLIKIVGDLLMLSELESDIKEIELSAVDIESAAHDVLALFEKKASDKGLGLDFSFSGSLPEARLDRYMIEQMLINLLENAINYTDKGRVELFIEVTNSALFITVSDTGPGIEKEHQGRIFERFYVADKSRSRRTGGTGLGLSIVKHIVLAHGGGIKLESAPGKGTSFTVWLPVKLS